ncbi:MAG TPA: hypothetical protein VEB40_15830 [Flavipsychrobacter sp.]|nr:hypothetical protein [Flavipsychrobacter sp.]
MAEEKDHIRDLAEIRSMMERSSKFLSLAGWAGIMAGIYALAGVYIAHNILHFRPDEEAPDDLRQLCLLAVAILVLAIGTALLLSGRKASTRGERGWNATSRRLLAHMAVPLAAGGVLILILLSQGMIGLIVPMTLIFYGLALFNAGKFTYGEVKFMGIIQIVLGLLSAYFVAFGLFFWAIGFGIVHIAYGIYIHYKYER